MVESFSEEDSVRVLRVYCDTSVFGGCFDEEFSEASLAVFEDVRQGAFVLVASDTTLAELDGTPQNVQTLLRELPAESVERVLFTGEVRMLRDAYIEAGVVGPASNRDAAHIASATVANADIIVSWNFKHIVHLEKIKGYHGVNRTLGYPEIPIHSPPEVI